MAYIKTAQVDVLPFPSDPNFTVTMKRKASFGDTEKASAGMLQIDVAPDLKGFTPKVDPGAYIKSLVLSMVVSWTVTDEDDSLLPVTEASLYKLDPVDGQFLIDEATKRSKARPEAQEVPFVKPSSDSSPATQ